MDHPSTLRAICLLGILLLAMIGLTNRTCSIAQDTAPSDDRIAAAISKLDGSIVRLEIFGSIHSSGESPVLSTSATVIGDDGLLISSLFALEQSDINVMARNADGSRVEVEILCRDFNRNLAILKLADPSGLALRACNAADHERIGQTVLALGRGHKSGELLISEGVISARERIWGKALQTDAKVSPIHYGGPLVDLQGDVVGILTPLDLEQANPASGSHYYDSGIGFAIPIRDLLSLLDRMQNESELKSGQLPFTFESSNWLDAPVVSAANLSPDISNQGLIAGSQVIAVNGIEVTRLGALHHVIGGHYADDEVELRFKSPAGDENSIAVHLVAELERTPLGWLGVSLDRNQSDAVVVDQVLPDSPAAEIGLRRGDRIVGWQNAPIKTLDEFLKAMAAAAAGDEVEIEVQNGEGSATHRCTLAAFPGAPFALNLEAGSEPQSVDSVAIELPEAAGRFRAMVPQWDPQRPRGLIVWLNAPGGVGDWMSVENWQQVAARTQNVVLLADSLDPTQWHADDWANIRSAIQLTQRRFNLQSRPLAIGGAGAGAQMAFLSVARHRSQFTGLCLVDCQLDQPWPATGDASTRLLVQWVSDVQSDPSEFTVLTEAGCAVWQTQLATSDSAAVMNAIIQWAAANLVY